MITKLTSAMFPKRGQTILYGAPSNHQRPILFELAASRAHADPGAVVAWLTTNRLEATAFDERLSAWRERNRADVKTAAKIIVVPILIGDVLQADDPDMILKRCETRPALVVRDLTGEDCDLGSRPGQVFRVDQLRQLAEIFRTASLIGATVPAYLNPPLAEHCDTLIRCAAGRGMGDGIPITLHAEKFVGVTQPPDLVVKGLSTANAATDFLYVDYDPDKPHGIFRTAPAKADATVKEPKNAVEALFKPAAIDGKTGLQDVL